MACAPVPCSELGADVLWIMPIHPSALASRRGAALGDPTPCAISTPSISALGDATALRRGWTPRTRHAHHHGLDAQPQQRRSSVHAQHPHWYKQRADSIYYPSPIGTTSPASISPTAGCGGYLIDGMRSWIERFDFDGLRSMIPTSRPAISSTRSAPSWRRCAPPPPRL
jgi:hypothetical protein